MLNDNQLTGIERGANRYFGDGLLDIAVGLVLLLAGISLMLDLAALAGVWVAVTYPLIWSAKKIITVPRLPRGSATLSESRLVKLLISGALLGLVLLAAGGLIAFVLFESSPGLREGIKSFGGPVLGLLAAAGLAVIGWATGARRFYAYAALPLVAVAGSDWISLAFPVYVALVGAAILLAGLVVLIRFVRKYPAR
jgi:hypothetical protein